jgi:propanediol dehydratase small subunit
MGMLFHTSGSKNIYRRWIIRRDLNSSIGKRITNRFESTEHAKGAKCTGKRHFVVDYAVDTRRQELVNKQGTPPAAKLDSKTLDNITSQQETLFPQFPLRNK